MRNLFSNPFVTSALIAIVLGPVLAGCSNGTPNGENADLIHRDWFDKHAYIVHGSGATHDPDCPCGHGNR